MEDSYTASDTDRPQEPERGWHGPGKGPAIASLCCGAAACAIAHGGWIAAIIAGLPGMASAICAIAFGAIASTAHGPSSSNSTTRTVGLIGLGMGVIAATTLMLTFMTAMLAGGMGYEQTVMPSAPYGTMDSCQGSEGGGAPGFDWLLENIGKAK